MDVILVPLIQMIATVIDLYVWILIIGVVLSWLTAFNVVNMSNRFVSSVKIVKGADEIDGKSILGILTLAATQGTSIRLLVSGKDEEAAMSALVELIANRFDEKE